VSEDAARRTDMAVAAARAVAAAHGLLVDAPTVLNDGVNVVVDLGSVPVVARVATLTPLLRPDIEIPFARDVALAAALAAAGAPVVPPSDLLPPGPHRHEGRVLTFWTRVDELPERPTPRRAAASFHELQEALAGQPVTGAPLDTPLGDLDTFVRQAGMWGVDEGARAALAARVEQLRPLLDGDAVQLHGDAHPGNLLATRQGWRWVDLEDSCSGPVAWDLACLRATSRLDGRAALDALPGAPSDDALRPWLELRRLHAAAWAVVYAVGHPEHTAAARARLSAVLSV
jgi:aminoglycoside phosphotransferase (APT) family kinase protein